jgi:hypothetical protein
LASSLCHADRMAAIATESDHAPSLNLITEIKQGLGVLMMPHCTSVSEHLKDLIGKASSMRPGPGRNHGISD